MDNGRAWPLIALTAACLGTWGCATKKYVHESVSPVQQQVNQVQKDTAANKTAIGDLDRAVASADEKAQDAGRRAQEAANAAARANSAAQQAGSKADAANSLAQQAMSRVDVANQRLKTALQNLDNYQLANTVQVFFGFAQSALSPEAKGQLDQAVTNTNGMREFLIEVEGFTDKTGSRDYNLELARHRAEAVVRYLSVEKNIPLRNLRMLGIGSEFQNADNRTRDARKQNRRVDVKIYALNITG